MHIIITAVRLAESRWFDKSERQYNQSCWKTVHCNSTASILLVRTEQRATLYVARFASVAKGQKVYTLNNICAESCSTLSPSFSTTALECRLGFTRLPCPTLDQPPSQVPSPSFKHFMSIQSAWSRPLRHILDPTFLCQLIRPVHSSVLISYCNVCESAQSFSDILQMIAYHPKFSHDLIQIVSFELSNPSKLFHSSRDTSTTPYRGAGAGAWLVCWSLGRAFIRFSSQKISMTNPRDYEWAIDTDPSHYPHVHHPSSLFLHGLLPTTWLFYILILLLFL
jgi:hypothetical protein